MKRVLIYILLLIIIFISLFIIFRIEMNNEIIQENTVGKVAEDTDIPKPDRIIYKNKEGKYVIIYHDVENFQLIYNELYYRISGINEGKTYTEYEITKMQDEGQFIEFDYDTKSKNYVFFLDNPELGIIKRTANGGQVILNDLKDKESLIKKLEDWTKYYKKYDFNRDKNYTLKSSLDTLPNITNLVEEKEWVYQSIIDNNEIDYQNAVKLLGAQSPDDIPAFDPNYETAIITLSKYEIKNIKQNIGNIKYEFGDYQDKYFANILIVSKIVNTNCIYYNINSSALIPSESMNTNIDDYAVEYTIKDGKYYANYNNQQIEIIPLDKASDIADNEAKKEKYQYQSWRSEFYSRGKNMQDSVSAELISDLSPISKGYHWNPNWQVGEYRNTLMWKIRLFDENDPLTNLYIYVNAINGDIVGAGDSSD